MHAHANNAQNIPGIQETHTSLSPGLPISSVKNSHDLISIIIPF